MPTCQARWSHTPGSRRTKTQIQATCLTAPFTLGCFPTNTFKSVWPTPVKKKILGQLKTCQAELSFPLSPHLEKGGQSHLLPWDGSQEPGFFASQAAAGEPALEVGIWATRSFWSCPCGSPGSVIAVRWVKPMETATLSV